MNKAAKMKLAAAITRRVPCFSLTPAPSRRPLEILHFIVHAAIAAQQVPYIKQHDDHGDGIRRSQRDVSTHRAPPASASRACSGSSPEFSPPPITGEGCCVRNQRIDMYTIGTSTKPKMASTAARSFVWLPAAKRRRIR